MDPVCAAETRADRDAEAERDGKREDNAVRDFCPLALEHRERVSVIVCVRDTIEEVVGTGSRVVVEEGKKDRDALRDASADGDALVVVVNEAFTETVIVAEMDARDIDGTDVELTLLDTEATAVDSGVPDLDGVSVAIDGLEDAVAVRVIVPENVASLDAVG